MGGDLPSSSSKIRSEGFGFWVETAAGHQCGNPSLDLEKYGVKEYPYY